MPPSATTPPAPPGDSETEKVNLLRIAYVHYTHAGFEREHQFLQDFGFTEVSRVNVGKPNEKIYYRGYGTEPFLYCSTKGEEDAFGGAAFVVESRKDLELAARVIPTATEIWEMKDAPGGGECVTVKDPVDGFMVHLVYGQAQRELDEQHEQRVFNFVGALLRKIPDERVTGLTMALFCSQRKNIAPRTNSSECKKVSTHKPIPNTSPILPPGPSPNRPIPSPQTRPLRLLRHQLRQIPKLLDHPLQPQTQRSAARQRGPRQHRIHAFRPRPRIRRPPLFLLLRGPQNARAPFFLRGV